MSRKIFNLPPRVVVAQRVADPNGQHLIIGRGQTKEIALSDLKFRTLLNGLTPVGPKLVRHRGTLVHA